MNKREIVIEALNHRQVSPLPYVLSMTEDLRRKVIAHTGDPDFQSRAGSYLIQEGHEEFVSLGGGIFRDRFGVVWDRGEHDDIGVIRDFQLKEPMLDGYAFPAPNEKLIREKCERLSANTELFRVFNVGFSLFERAWTLRSMTEVLCDMIEYPEFLDELFDRILEYNLEVVDIVSKYPIDCVLFGDDWGQQKGLIMGYPHWKRYIRPRLKEMYAHVREKGMFVGQHSCGDCREVFPDLVELGLNIYNTFQPEVYDIVDFKKRFGDHITFYGGISTQRLLPFATPDEVKREMHRIMDILGKDGGYIVAPTHAMPGDIPPENVLAFLDVCQNENPK